jgi:hypothetical protein
VKIALAIITFLSFSAASARADSTHVEPLATVAHRLGFVYAYLGPDDEVSLVGHGLSVIVRPGVPYINVNDRVEPIQGEAPQYGGGDLLISPAFAHQLTLLERAAAKTVLPGHANAVAENPAHINVAAPGGPPHNVTAVTLDAVPGSEDVAVSGQATPGSLVAITLKATASPLLPTIFLNRSFAVTGPDGQFTHKISIAPDYFTGSILFAEVSAIDDAKPMTASYSPPGK